MKKLLAFALTFVFVTALTLGSVGCSKKEEPKGGTPAADTKDKTGDKAGDKAGDKKTP